MAKFNPDYNDQPRIDAEQIIKVINSCKTRPQLRIAEKMIKLWEAKHYYIWRDADYKMKALHNQMNDADDNATLGKVLYNDDSTGDF